MEPFPITTQYKPVACELRCNHRPIIYEFTFQRNSFQNNAYFEHIKIVSWNGDSLLSQFTKCIKKTIYKDKNRLR